MQGDTYEAMKEDDSKSCNICSAPEQCHRNERVFSHSRLTVDESEDHESTYYQQCNNLS